LQAWPGSESTTLDISSQSGSFDPSAMDTPKSIGEILSKWYFLVKVSQGGLKSKMPDVVQANQVWLPPSVSHDEQTTLEKCTFNET